MPATGIVSRPRATALPRLFAVVLSLVPLIPLLCGCALSKDPVKLRDLEFVVLSPEKIPKAVQMQIEEQKEEPFCFSYRDEEFLYLCTGYGKQDCGGYSIAVEELYLTEENIHVDTALLGPKQSDQKSKTPSYPYIVLRMEAMEEGVVFE